MAENDHAGVGSYVYLATRAIDDRALDGLTGIGGAEVRLLRSGDLAAAVSSVALSEFGEDALRRNLEDLNWLEQVARDHGEVIGRVSEVATVAPLQLATILYDDDRVKALLDDWRSELTATLDRVQGCWEWSVKIITEADRPAPVAAADDHAETGSDYLRRRKAELTQRSQHADDLAALTEEIHRELSAHTVASRRLAPQDRRLTGHRGEMQLNGAYLVGQDDSDAFNDCVQQLGEQHRQLQIQLNGPWPAYSFATLEPGEPVSS